MISIDVDGAVNKTGGSFSLVITCNGRSEVESFYSDKGKDINVMEMKGINAAMKYFLNKKPNEMGVINTDSLLSVKLITEKWVGLNPSKDNKRLKKELRKGRKIYAMIKDRVVLKYINREYNSADQYAKQTLKQLTKEAHKNEG